MLAVVRSYQLSYFGYKKIIEGPAVLNFEAYQGVMYELLWGNEIRKRIYRVSKKCIYLSYLLQQSEQHFEEEVLYFHILDVTTIP